MPMGNHPMASGDLCLRRFAKFRSPCKDRTPIGRIR
jgi:hypothetical protein